MLLRLAVLGIMVLLAGCATVPPPSLSLTDLQRYRLAGVSVENAQIVRSWPTQEQVYLKANPADEGLRSQLATQPASAFPQVTAHFQRVMEERVRTELASQVGDVFTGPRPVRAVVRLKAFDVPSAGRRILVGGGAGMRADIDLVDASTGATLLHYEGPAYVRPQVGGLATVVALAIDDSDTGAEVLTEYVKAYGRWLRQN